MRLRIRAVSESPCFIPYNYNYQLHAAVYRLIQSSSPDYSQFLHDMGFIRYRSHLKKFKLFTFSKLRFSPYNHVKGGFASVERIEFVFSTCVDRSFQHLVYGLFADQIMRLQFGERANIFHIEHVEALQEPESRSWMKCLCLSPMVVSTSRDRGDGTKEPHYLDYMNPVEKEHFISNIQKNLIGKYETIHDINFAGDTDFSLEFDPDYLIRKQGKVSKLIRFKKDVDILGFEAPFTVNGDPELIKVGYQCGFGEKNSAGFGCVEEVRTREDAD